MTQYLSWILGGLLMAGTAQAQTDQAQLVRPLGAADLNSNLARLSANPRDVDALIGAGEAALALDEGYAVAHYNMGALLHAQGGAGGEGAAAAEAAGQGQKADAAERVRPGRRQGPRMSTSRSSPSSPLPRVSAANPCHFFL